jgi:hypothetical protein
MIKRNLLFVALYAISALMLAAPWSVSAIDKDVDDGRGRPRGFSNASLQGAYAVWGVSDGPDGTVAGVGVISFDGNGNVSAVVTFNQPDPVHGGRVLSQREGKGSYTVKKDGQGILEGISGSVEVEDIFVITRSNEEGIAQELFVIFGDAGRATGALPVFRLTRQRP